MSRKLKNALIAILILCILAGLAAALYLSKRVTMNPSGTVGNTGGNLNNGGYFCEYDGAVYFSNPAEGGSLFVMDPDEGNPRRLNSLKVGNILAGGDYLYYFQQGAAQSQETGIGALLSVHAFERCRLDGSGSATLTSDVVVTGQLVDNYLYLLTSSSSGISFYKLKIDRSEQVELADYAINPACALDGLIYYNGTQPNHYLYALDTRSDIASEFWRGNVWYPVRSGDYVYYLDVAENYRLCRYSISRNEIQVMTEDRVDCFNVGSGYLYYQTNSATSPQLRFMSTEGGESYVLAEGVYCHINLTSRYVYFQPFDDDSTMYHAPLGSTGYSLFAPQTP